MVGGYPRFQYGGLSFSVVDPWPEYWSDNWYDNDDMYIDYSGMAITCTIAVIPRIESQ